jgi:hypothetical protein
MSVPKLEPAAVGAAVLASYQAQRDAMVAGDTEALADELADGFTLTHMTGYVQSKREWLAHVDSGEMAYHAMADVDLRVADTDTAEPVLVARTLTDATIWGGRGVWSLQLEIHFHHDGSRWAAARTVASTW